MQLQGTTSGGLPVRIFSSSQASSWPLRGRKLATQLEDKLIHKRAQNVTRGNKATEENVRLDSLLSSLVQ